MVKKSQRTIEVYEEVGALLRLLKTVGVKAVCEANDILYKADMDKLIQAVMLVDSVCDKAEENMFKDHPGLSKDYVDVFYGTFFDAARNKTDLRVRKSARRSADELFAGKGN